MELFRVTVKSGIIYFTTPKRYKGYGIRFTSVRFLILFLLRAPVCGECQALYTSVRNDCGCRHSTGTATASDRYCKRKATEYETVQKNIDWTRRQLQIMTSERDRLTGVGLGLPTEGLPTELQIMTSERDRSTGVGLGLPTRPGDREGGNKLQVARTDYTGGVSIL